MPQEEFHEIQLNGKQLVFLFMAGTVAAVVIFLSGLMVGRNIRAPRLEAAVNAGTPVADDPTRPAGQEEPPPVAAGTEPRQPASINENLSYAEKLEDPTPADEDFAPADERRSARTDKPAPAAVKTPEPVAPAATPAATQFNEPAGNGWTVQVQAVKTRTEAEAIARRLNAKGYRAFVTMRAEGLYGIRVGKYPNKRDAEAMKVRLEKNEQFKPWVTR